jgi:hypothetical protein
MLISRLSIVQNIDINTPIIVLKEIALCHNINCSFDKVDNIFIENFIEQITNNPIGVINQPFTNEDWNVIAKYVNPNEIWNILDLERAYNHLKNWETSFYIPSYFDYGMQTPRNIFKLNACVLYKICKNYNVPLHQNLTLLNLAGICKIIESGSSYGISLIYNNLTKLTKLNLINMYIESLKYNTDNYTTIDTTIDTTTDTTTDDNSIYDYIPECITQFNNKNFLRTRIIPKTKTEAIVLAAFNYRLDISLSGNPIKEYFVIQRDPDNYIPNDHYLKTLHDLNQQLLCLNEYFNPCLPADLYQDDVLNNMAKIEGYSNDDIYRDTAYTLLQLASYSNTFYDGKQPGIVNEQTPFYYDNVCDLHSDLIVCYGVKSINSMTAFRYKELAELFKNTNNFINPVNKDIFSTISIKKLKNLCLNIKPYQSKESENDKKELYNAIINTELFTKDCFNKAKTLYNSFTTSEQEIKQQIKNCIWSLFKLSMYMRGWNGKDEVYPIENAPVDNQTMVDLLVTQELIEFEKNCNNLGEIGDNVLDLPLLIYHGDEFIPISNTQGGKTIKERLEIVKMGNDYSEYDSCIRLTSNLLATSCYKYMQMLDMDIPFKIEKLRDIS